MRCAAGDVARRAPFKPVQKGFRVQGLVFRFRGFDVKNGVPQEFYKGLRFRELAQLGGNLGGVAIRVLQDRGFKRRLRLV